MQAKFSTYTPLSSNAELARRTLRPLSAARLEDLLARTGKTLAAQPIDLTKENFVLYVPPQQPAGGYGLLVFVPPWNDARFPEEWAQVLDQFGVIFVAAAQSGNDQRDVGRREPLAILAEQNVVKTYSVDPHRIVIAGFSGGSRVALRLALAYADLFKGAILDAGSDPVSDDGIPIPPRPLFLEFQESTHIVYATGERDIVHQSADAASRRAMRAWCQFNVDTISPDIEHVLIGATALATAFQTLFANQPPDAAKLASCRAAIDGEMNDRLRKAEQLATSGETSAARDGLKDIDKHYGGLAAPRLIDLSSKIGPGD